jgi:hypothetical protein
LTVGEVVWSLVASNYHGKVVAMQVRRAVIEIVTEIEIAHNNAIKLDQLLSIGPLYLAIQDL